MCTTQGEWLSFCVLFCERTIDPRRGTGRLHQMRQPAIGIQSCGLVGLTSIIYRFILVTEIDWRACSLPSVSTAGSREAKALPFASDSVNWSACLSVARL
jgi:hypothetical protein